MRCLSSCISLALSFAFFTATAGAQQQPPAQPAPPAEPQPKSEVSGPAKSSSQFTMRREEAGGADAQTARSRARAGDCAGALPSFDAAIKNTVEPGLRRDRGLCHEKLGHPFPAMEDYRAYIAALPEAPDSDQIRQRLTALEGSMQNKSAGVGAPVDGYGPGMRASMAASSGSGTVVAGETSSSKSGSTPPGPREGEAFDHYTQQEKQAEAAASSPLRNGKGFVIGAFLHMPRFFIGEGARGTLAYGVGGTFRYSLGPTLTLLTEFGVGGQGESGAASSRSGPLLLGGVELRLPISRWAADHILLRGGVGYERPVVSGTRFANDILLGRFAVGYRHVWGPSVGLEFLADGGPAYVMPEGSSNRINAVVGGSVAFVVGF